MSRRPTFAPALLAAVLLASGALAAGCSSAQVAGDGPPHVDAPAALDGPPGDADGDAGLDGATDGAIDAEGDAAPPCPISTGDSPVLDGTGDLAAYPASQVLTPGVPLQATDRVAITWDPMYLYVTATAGSFADPFKPLHVYVETGDALPAAAPSMGKEYGGDVPFLPFAANHLIAVRRQDDSGTGAYDGVYLPDMPVSWTTRTAALVPGTDVFASADNGTLSVRTPWAALGGCPTTMRLAAHVVNGDVGNDWKDTVPTTHTPWMQPGGGYYEIDLTADPAIAGWTQH
ncbi:MAG TPA: hypothetical protein VHE35_03335 [Kofleriaceae bacterium]|nr:hypothetical protein [Kofleriaceae bacterium]